MYDKYLHARVKNYLWFEIFYATHSLLCPMLMYRYLHIVRIGLLYWALNLRLSCFIPLERGGLYRLSPFPSLSVKILNAEFAAKLIITTNFEFIVFSCCWKCPQHQLCFQSIRILHLCASLLINSESSSTAHESSTKVKCTEIDFKYVPNIDDDIL